MPKLTLSQLQKMPRNKKLRLYAGGEIRYRTVGWLIKQKEMAQKKRRKKKR